MRLVRVRNTLTAICVGVKGQRDVAFPFMLHIYSPSLLKKSPNLKCRDDEKITEHQQKRT